MVNKGTLSINNNMKYNFTLPDFPVSVFEIEVSIWTGKSNLYMDNNLLKQSTEKGKPFLIPTTDGEYVKAFSKPSYLDMVPALEINGVKNQIVEKLKWYQYTLALLPVLLIFVGGAIGGGVGITAALINLNIFRIEGEAKGIKYLKVIGVVLLAYLIYFLVAFFLLKMFR